jgi:hypothetical protein
VSERSGEALRREALGALGPASDERARVVLAGATLSLAEGIAKWEASEGTVVGHRVTVSLGASELGLLRALPRVADELRSALATAVARRPREALSELDFRWSAASPPRQVGYRDAPPLAASQELREALAEYAAACGEPEIAGLLATSEVEETRGTSREVRVRADLPHRETARGPRVLSFVTRAVRDLLGDERVAVALRFRP